MGDVVALHVGYLEPLLGRTYLDLKEATAATVSWYYDGTKFLEPLGYTWTLNEVTFS